MPTASAITIHTEKREVVLHYTGADGVTFQDAVVIVENAGDSTVKTIVFGLKVSQEGKVIYEGNISPTILDMADACCDGKVAMALEGGYDLAALGESVREVLMEMTGLQFTDKNEIMALADPRKIDYTLWRTRHIHKKYWKCLATPGNGNEPATPSILVRLRQSLTRLAAYFKS